MQKRFLCLLVMIVCLCAFPALARVTYPEKRGYVNDDAAVLSMQTAKDIDLLNDRMNGAEFTVVTRHFLGGADAQEYCKGLFDYWWLDEDDVLLLLVIGEERYAVVMGDAVKSCMSEEQLSSLLSSQLRAPFINERDYDGAIGSFLLSVSAQIARGMGENLNTGGLFGTEETVKSEVFDNWSGNWWEGFFADVVGDDEWDGAPEYAGDTYYYEAYEDDTDISRLAIIAIVLVFIVSRRRKKGKSGLGLIGWLLTFSGLKEVRKLFRGR